MKPGAINFFTFLQTLLEQFGVKKKNVTVLVNKLFYHKDLEISCTGEPARAPLGHPGSRQPLRATRCPLAPLRAGGWTGLPPRSLPTSTSSHWLTFKNQRASAMRKTNKNKKSIPGVEKLKYYCELFCTVLSELFLFFLYSSFFFFANHCQCQSQYQPLFNLFTVASIYTLQHISCSEVASCPGF